MKALIVDDDRVLADVVAFALRREGFQVIQAFDGLTALQRWAEDKPDLIVLDVNLPKMDGFTVCQRIRKESDVPIIMLTVRSEDNDIVYGLDLGADDYIAKPFSPRQLVARAHAVLRRTGQNSVYAPVQAGALSLAATRREVSIGDREPVALTSLEGRLLHYLMVNSGQVMTIDAIIDHVWGPQGGDRDMLRQLVRRLRNKIELDPAQPKFIRTVPGLGYGLLVNEE
jgi:DNA-binding response OmpR family regulator